jgi:hypothetical protein
MVRETLEAGGLTVVGDAKSQVKYDGGACESVQQILGLMYDCTDPTNPRVGLPEAKQKDLLKRLKALQVVKGSKLDHAEVESVAHKLSAACAATERGRVYLCGFYAALRKEKDGKIEITAWLRRNINWWVKYFESGAPRMKLLLPRPSLGQRFCPHTDASTTWGYGGHFIKNINGQQVCYYIQGKWTERELEIIDKHGGAEGVGIAFLEMAAVEFLLAAAETVGGFEGNSFDYYCDNQNAVSILNSYRSRTLPLSLLLERIDSRLEGSESVTAFLYINTLLNKGSDALSRNAYGEFVEYITHTYGTCTFIPLQVPSDVRNIARTVAKFDEHPEWVVLDGRCDGEN